VVNGDRLHRDLLRHGGRRPGSCANRAPDDKVNLARLLREQGDLAGAEGLLRRTLVIDRRVHGEVHENVAYDLKELANLLVDLGRSADAETTYRQSLAMYRQTVAPDSPYVAVTLNGLGKALLEAGLAREAEPVLRESSKVAAASLPDGHWLLLTSRSLLGACLGAMGRHG
jgi:tetratricopeptide (TPR) repeat protein